MKARVKDGAPNKVCTAFVGHEYVWYEWRDVPAGFESAAREHDYLEIEDIGPVLAVDLDDLTFRELQRRASENGLYKRGMNKADLINELRDD